MPVTTVAAALRLAINVLRDSAESRRMPSGVMLDERPVELHIEAAETFEDFLQESNRLKELLRANEYFCSLPAQVQRRCLDGESAMIAARQEMLEKVGWNIGHFRAFFDLLSQHAYILPLSFYRIEPNGRGTGLENEADRGSLCTMLEICAEVLGQCTALMVDAFPDTAAKRQGKKSKFSPGPRGNLPH